MFTIGDKVVITNEGEMYTTYKKWVEKNAIKYFYYYEKMVERNPIDLEGTIIKIAQHERESYGTLYLILLEDGIVLMGENGIKLKDKEERIMENNTICDNCMHQKVCIYEAEYRELSIKANQFMEDTEDIFTLRLSCDEHKKVMAQFR